MRRSQRWSRWRNDGTTTGSDHMICVLMADSGEPYCQRLAQILEDHIPEVDVVAWRPTMSRRPSGFGTVVLLLQWSDYALRGGSWLGAVRRILRLLRSAVLLRLQGVQVVWTVHNPPGKGHSRIRLDRALRCCLILLASRVIVLNDRVISEEGRRMPRPVRWRLQRRAVVVPHPTGVIDHGKARTKDESRAELGIDCRGLPIVMYAPGGAREDLTEAVVDEQDRYLTISVNRSGTTHRLLEHAGGWTYDGRPDNATYGTLISAADSVVLSDPEAYGSATVHAAVAMRRPVISPRCPATDEIVDSGLGLEISRPSPCQIAAAIQNLSATINEGLSPSFSEFERNHDASAVVNSILRVLRR